jgi:predicted transposase YdaD
LCRHQRTSAQAVAYAAAKIQQQEIDRGRWADLLTIMGIFGRLADRSLEVIPIIGREQMKESPFYQEIMQEGEVKRAREDILAVVRLRFGDEAVAECQDLINAIDNLERLNELHQQAVVSRRFSQFRRCLTSQSSS